MQCDRCSLQFPEHKKHNQLQVERRNNTLVFCFVEIGHSG